MFVIIVAAVGNSESWLNQRSYGWKKREVCKDTTHQTHPPLISIISFTCMEPHVHDHPNHPPCSFNLSPHVVHLPPTRFHYFHMYVSPCSFHHSPPMAILHPPCPLPYPTLYLSPTATIPQNYSTNAQNSFLSLPYTVLPSLHIFIPIFAFLSPPFSLYFPCSLFQSLSSLSL